MNTFFKLSILTSFCLLSACSEKKTQNNFQQTSSTQEEIETPLETTNTGAYQAKLTPLNGKVSGTLSGSLNIVREDDRLIFHVRFSGGPKEAIAHVQNIRTGTKCPTEEADTNGDGFIDIIEGMPYFGDSLVPLDGDLNSQKGGANYWPVTDPFGDYQYSEIASYSRFYEDLKNEDTDLNDDLVKLSHEESINLIGKVIVIHGVSSSKGIPSSVATRGRYANYQMLPIACGVIQKAGEAPGVADDGKGSWPLPEGSRPTGETVGGASGSDDGAIFRTPYPLESTTGGVEGGEPTRDNRVDPPQPETEVSPSDV